MGYLSMIYNIENYGKINKTKYGYNTKIFKYFYRNYSLSMKQ